MTVDLEAALRLADEAERVAAKADPGPWRYTDPDDKWPYHVVSDAADIIAEFCTQREADEDFVEQSERNGRFAAHARTSVPALASTVRGLVERVKELEREASTNSVLLTAAQCSYKIAAKERAILANHIDFPAAAWVSFHLDGVGDLKPATNYEKCTFEWELPDGRRAGSILQAIRMTLMQPEE